MADKPEAAEPNKQSAANTIERAIEEISGEIERMKGAGDDFERADLYAKLDGLLPQINSLIRKRSRIPDDLLLFARKNVRVIAGAFGEEEQLNEVVRYLLTDAPVLIIEAYVKAAIEGLHDADTATSVMKCNAILNAGMEASHGTEAAEVIKQMWDEAQRGLR